ncbi:MAG: cytidylate kinase-like family protein [Paludibacteraceae bacterium]|nr:cytidylate kinase-like family protein [Paludibacteraceae bacterium]
MENTVISIGRQFGAGGRTIGQKLAERFGFKYYDKELITLAAKEIGFDVDIFEKADEKPGFMRFFQNIIGNSCFDDNYMSNTALFKVQSDVIKKLSEDGPCVIVGRCSDYVLRNNPKMVSIFLSANEEDKVKLVTKRSGVSEEKALKLIRNTNSKRADYYNTYSGREWGVASNYHLCVDVSSLGIDKTVDLIEKFVRERNGL